MCVLVIFSKEQDFIQDFCWGEQCVEALPSRGSEGIPP